MIVAGTETSERKRGAFGIGALEDEDDHEVYDHIERSDYDFETGGAEGESTQGKGPHGPSSALIGPSAASSSASAGEGIASGDGGKCSDGMPALVGFVVANRSSLPDKWYTAPAVPHSFRPFHEFKAEEGETGQLQKSERPIHISNVKLNDEQPAAAAAE